MTERNYGKNTEREILEEEKKVRYLEEMKRKLEEHLDFLRHEEELRQREGTKKKLEQERLALVLSGKAQGEENNWL